MTDLEIVKCDKAPTGKGKCFSCRGTIPKGTPRVWYNGTMAKDINGIKGMNVKRLICFRCSEWLIGIERRCHKQELKRLAYIKRQFRRKMKGKIVKKIIERNNILDNLVEKDL